MNTSIFLKKSVSGLICAVLVATPFQSAKASAQATARSILNMKGSIDEELNSKANAFTKTLNFKADGSIDGKIDGQLEGGLSASSQGLNFRKGLIGGLLGAGGGGIASLLAGATGLQTVLLGAAGGAAIGGIAGALMKNKPMATGSVNGSLSGEIHGSYKAEGWDNHFSPVHYNLFVVDTQMLGALQARSGTTGAPCAKTVIATLQAIVDSGRYFEPAQATKIMSDLVTIRHNLGVLEDEILSESLSAVDARKMTDFLTRTQEWLKKRITVVSMARHGLEVYPHGNLTLGSAGKKCSNAAQLLEATSNDVDSFMTSIGPKDIGAIEAASFRIEKTK